MFDLTGKIALVTGAASGIGEAIAKTLANAGAFVYVADLDEANGERVAVEIGDGNGRIHQTECRRKIANAKRSRKRFWRKRQTRYSRQ